MKNQFIVCRDIKGKKYKVRSNELEFRPSIYGLVFKAGKILLAKTFDGYDFPGGAVEKGERFEQALVREVWEETGIKVKPQALLTVQEDFFIRFESKGKFHSILIFYICTNPKGKISAKNLTEFEKIHLGGAEAEWIDLKDIKKIKFYNGVESVELIKTALKMKGRAKL
jgi:8-oxo-dGTP diphosphatase